MEAQTFLDEMWPRVIETETALHNGDNRQRIAMWSRTEPLTLFGAYLTAQGWPEIHGVFEKLGEMFSHCESYENEVLAARVSGDLAYTVALEHTTASVNGVPRSYTLRATTIFCREEGEWKVVHRHGDELRPDSAPQ
jgi:Ketosteroid isomerase homolog